MQALRVIILTSVFLNAIICATGNKAQATHFNLKKIAHNLAAAHGVHLALHASHQVGHVIAAQVALWNGCKPLSQNYRLEFNPISHGLYATSTVPVFESKSTNALVTIAGPILGIFAAVCALKAWHYYYDPKEEKNIKECILESFKTSVPDALPAIPAIALTHLTLNAGMMLPINHPSFEGYKVAKDLGWI